MRSDLVDFLCDPIDHSNLTLSLATTGDDGDIQSGVLSSESGRQYPIVDGIPRFVRCIETARGVASFGNEWNYFNYDLFKINWLTHVVAHTFGTTDVFRDKVIVDCGAGSGMQSKWMAELGAERVIALELSHSVDGVMRRNLAGMMNVDIVQCSIDQPPLKSGCIHGIVICHNVIQHTPSVEDTARALWRCVGTGGEFAFNCYMKYPDDWVWSLRWRLVYRPMRAFLSRRSFQTALAYAKTMACLRFVPLLGTILERAQFVVCGDVPQGPDQVRRQYKSAVLNTFDWYGSHQFQHQKSKEEIRALVSELQPDETLRRNVEAYLTRQIPPGLAMRLAKSTES